MRAWHYSRARRKPPLIAEAFLHFNCSGKTLLHVAARIHCDSARALVLLLFVGLAGSHGLGAPLLGLRQIRLARQPHRQNPRPPCAGISGSDRPSHRRSWPGWRLPDSDTSGPPRPSGPFSAFIVIHHLFRRLRIAFTVVVDPGRPQSLQTYSRAPGSSRSRRPCRPLQDPLDRPPELSSASPWPHRVS